MPRIPLLDLLKSLGGDQGVFAGFETIMSYGDPFQEHVSVRRDAALFDISHMGRILIQGPGAVDLLDFLVPKDLGGAEPGSMVGPTAFLNERGGFKDDVMLYKISGDSWLVVCNAINREKIFSWLSEWASRRGGGAVVRDITLDTVLLALQGPRSPEIISRIGLGDAASLGPLEFHTGLRMEAGEVWIVSRSGWTGEDGFEIVASPSVGGAVVRAARALGVPLAGLIARDSLRMEMGYVLYGEDIDEETNPFEARYWVFTRGKKGCYGCDALEEVGRRGVSRIRYMVRLRKGARTIPRKGARTLYNGVEIGKVTSGAYSPYLERSIGMGYVKSSHALPGMDVDVEIRGRLYGAKLLDFPLVRRGGP